MTIYSPFYPDTSFDGVAGSSLPATRNTPLGDWTLIANGTYLNLGDIVQYLGSSFMVNVGHTKTSTTAAPSSNGQYTLLAESGMDGQTFYTWFAYADSADGTVNFTTGASGTRTYIGIASNKTTAVESENPADYIWTKIVGAAGPAIVITPDKAGFTFVDGALSPAAQTITYTATLQSLTGTINWSTLPNIKTGTGSTFTISSTEMGTNQQVVITAYVGAVKQSITLFKIADPIADQTKWVDGPFQSTIFNYNYDNSAQTGEFNRDFTFKFYGSTGLITTGVTWSYIVVTGTFNGRNNSSGAAALTVSSGIATLTATSLDSSVASIQVSATYQGNNYVKTFDVTRKVATAPVNSTIASATSNFPGFNSTTIVDQAVLTAVMPSGKTTANIMVSLDAMPASGTSGSWTVNLALTRDISGTPTQLGATQTASTQWFASDFSGNSASFPIAYADNSLTPGVSYTWRIRMWLTSGTRTHFVTGVISVTV